MAVVAADTLDQDDSLVDGASVVDTSAEEVEAAAAVLDRSFASPLRAETAING